MRWTVRIAKRAIDIAGSMAGLAITAPAFPIIAAAIYLDDKGPIFYKQRRAGKLREVTVENGIRRFHFSEFYVPKFRTMRTDAEKFTGAVFAAKHDPRVTRVGRFLRKSRLDELPQLWEVFRGTMSLVGPRPERPEILENLAFAIPFFEERMRDLKPGVTGLAQIELDYTGNASDDHDIKQYANQWENPFELDELEEDDERAIADDMRLKLLYDVAYSTAMENLSTYLRMELRIIFMTPLVMLRGNKGQ